MKKLFFVTLLFANSALVLAADYHQELLDATEIGHNASCTEIHRYMPNAKSGSTTYFYKCIRNEPINEYGMMQLELRFRKNEKLEKAIITECYDVRTSTFFFSTGVDCIRNKKKL